MTSLYFKALNASKYIVKQEIMPRRPKHFDEVYRSLCRVTGYLRVHEEEIVRRKPLTTTRNYQTLCEPE
jgi:hypothetical protein